MPYLHSMKVKRRLAGPPIATKGRLPGFREAERSLYLHGMDPCHTKPFTQRGVIIDGRQPVYAEPTDASREPCDYCGAAALEWRKCKLICTNCRQINKSC